jgi:hypothetical protein
VSLTVRQTIVATFHEPDGLTWLWVGKELRAIDVDPDMPVEALRRRLTYGERVEGEMTVRQLRKFGTYQDGWNDLMEVLTGSAVRSPLLGDSRWAGSSGTETTP